MNFNLTRISKPTKVDNVIWTKGYSDFAFARFLRTNEHKRFKIQKNTFYLLNNLSLSFFGGRYKRFENFES